MASRKIPQINWTAIAERVPPHQKTFFAQFKAKSDDYLKRVLSYPEEQPKIDWNLYKASIPIPGMVDDFQKQYTSFKIPYPPDTVSPKIDEQEREVKAEIEKFKTASNARIEEYKKQLAHIASLLPFDQMTMEDFRDSYPDLALDPLGKPTFWPHLPEDQPGAGEKDVSHKH